MWQGSILGNNSRINHRTTTQSIQSGKAVCTSSSNAQRSRIFSKRLTTTCPGEAKVLTSSHRAFQRQTWHLTGQGSTSTHINCRCSFILFDHNCIIGNTTTCGIGNRQEVSTRSSDNCTEYGIGSNFKLTTCTGPFCLEFRRIADGGSQYWFIRFTRNIHIFRADNARKIRAWLHQNSIKGQTTIGLIHRPQAISTLSNYIKFEVPAQNVVFFIQPFINNWHTVLRFACIQGHRFTFTTQEKVTARICIRTGLSVFHLYCIYRPTTGDGIPNFQGIKTRVGSFWVE